VVRTRSILLGNIQPWLITEHVADSYLHIGLHQSLLEYLILTGMAELGKLLWFLLASFDSGDRRLSGDDTSTCFRLRESCALSRGGC
jgi:hypothetical protein